MPGLNVALVDEIRSASRQMVREFGFMEATLAATDYPPSAVHTVIEIGLRGPMTAMQLAEFLHLEKSSVSRMVRKLIEAGELKETTDPIDARSKPLDAHHQRAPYAGRASRFRPASGAGRARPSERI